MAVVCTDCYGPEWQSATLVHSNWCKPGRDVIMSGHSCSPSPHLTHARVGLFVLVYRIWLTRAHPHLLSHSCLPTLIGSFMLIHTILGSRSRMVQPKIEYGKLPKMPRNEIEKITIMIIIAAFKHVVMYFSWVRPLCFSPFNELLNLLV